jgi:hypothetical protein
MCEAFPDAQKMFHLDTIGLGQNTKEGDLKLYQEELQTNGTFAKIWSDSERSEAFPFGGHVPSSPVFHSSVAKYMKFGEMREFFFGEKGAAQNPAYDFIIDPSLNEAYQSLKNQMPQMQAAQQSLQLEQMQQQMGQAEQQAQQQQQEAEQAQQEPEQEGPTQEEQLAQSEDSRDQESHEQEMRHKEEKHRLNLRLAFQEAQAKHSASALSGIVHRAKTRAKG